MAVPAPVRSSRLSQAAIVLLRLVSDPQPLDPACAAARLREELGQDELLIRLLHARVALAMRDRPTPIDRRAIEVLELALAPSGLAEPGPVDAGGSLTHSQAASL